MNLTFQTAQQLLAQYPQARVRLDPRGNRGKEGSGHFGRGKLIEALPRHAVILPDGHRHTTTVGWDYVRLWKAQTPGFVPVIQQDHKKEPIMEDEQKSAPASSTPSFETIQASIISAANPTRYVVFHQRDNKVFAGRDFGDDLLKAKTYPEPRARQAASRLLRYRTELAKDDLLVLTEDAAMERMLYPEKFAGPKPYLEPVLPVSGIKAARGERAQRVESADLHKPASIEDLHRELASAQRKRREQQLRALFAQFPIRPDELEMANKWANAGVIDESELQLHLNNFESLLVEDYASIGRR